jgi:hypothetical protein
VDAVPHPSGGERKPGHDKHGGGGHAKLFAEVFDETGQNHPSLKAHDFQVVDHSPYLDFLAT